MSTPHPFAGAPVVLLVTLHRRYAELAKNLRMARERFLAELGRMPPVVVVWAAPEVGRMWVLQNIERELGLTLHIVKRPAAAGETAKLGIATSWLESQNIRLGLQFCLDQFGQESLVCMTAADVALQEGTVGLFLHEAIRNGHEAIVFHWQNPCTSAGAWHTNCWAVRAGAVAHWPPLSKPDDDDVLERQWGRSLEGLPGVFCWHNSGERRFLHRHESEHLDELPHRPQPATASLGLRCRGYLPLTTRLWGWLKKKLNDWYAWFGEPVWPEKQKDSSDDGK